MTLSLCFMALGLSIITRKMGKTLHAYREEGMGEWAATEGGSSACLAICQPLLLHAL